MQTADPNRTPTGQANRTDLRHLPAELSAKPPLVRSGGRELGRSGTASGFGLMLTPVSKGPTIAHCGSLTRDEYRGQPSPSSAVARHRGEHRLAECAQLPGFRQPRGNRGTTDRGA